MPLIDTSVLKKQDFQDYSPTDVEYAIDHCPKADAEPVESRYLEERDAREKEHPKKILSEVKNMGDIFRVKNPAELENQAEEHRWGFAKSVFVLGTEYQIQALTESEDPRLSDCCGFTDETSRRLVVGWGQETNLDRPREHAKKVLRHEITHAFLYESGLAECSLAHPDQLWAMNEEMIDWIARQGPKLAQAWNEAGCME